MTDSRFKGATPETLAKALLKPNRPSASDQAAPEQPQEESDLVFVHLPESMTQPILGQWLDDGRGGSILILPHLPQKKIDASLTFFGDHLVDLRPP